MDPLRFDVLARTLAASTTRRTTLAALVSGLLAARPDADAAAKRGKQQERGKGNGKSKDRRGGKDRKPAKDKDQPRRQNPNEAGPAVALPARCCASGTCDPGPGRNLTKCCFAGRDLTGANFRGTNSSQANFLGAVLANADFRGANLSNACLVDADLRGARLGGANLGGAIRCRTQTDAGIDNSGCERGTACCPTELGAPQPCDGPADCPDQPCQTKTCQNGSCAYAPITGPSPNGSCSFCCAGTCCQSPANQCNQTSGLCCAPNCAGRQCGPDGCGNFPEHTCGACADGQTCNETTGQCIGAPTCDPQLCPNGCCDSRGRCQPGNTIQACGTGGETCAVCDDDDEVCQGGQCVACDDICPCTGQSFCDLADSAVCYQRPPRQPGDEEPACFCLVSLTGESVCAGTFQTSPSNCTTDGDCRNYAPGAVCVAAAPGSVVCPTAGNFCAAPCCTPQSCPNGCCAGLTGCLPGNDAEACGTGGELCFPCPPGQVCRNGQCTNCDPACTCAAGRDFCVSGGPNVQCQGEDGIEPCFCTITVEDRPFCYGVIQPGSPSNCTSDDQCQSFAQGAACIPAAPSGSECPTTGNFCAAPCCTPQSCPNGCCFGGICVPGNTNAACGTGGTQCSACPGPCRRCEDGVCQPLFPNGAPCEQNSQCCSGTCSNGFCAA